LAVVSCLALAACAARTDPATNVGALTATLNGHGRTTGTPAHYFFQYATKLADLGTPRGQQTPERGPIPPNVPAGGGDVAFRENVSGLTPATTYYYRVCGGDQQIHPHVCAPVKQFTTAPSPTFTPHLFAASSSLKDITSIGSRLYVAGEPCPNAEPPPASQCSFVGNLALDGSTQQVDAPDGPVAAITRGPDGDPWLLTAGEIDIGPGGALTHFGLNLEVRPGSVSFGRSPPAAVTAADGALWVIENRGETTVGAWKTDGSPILGLGYDLSDIDPATSGGAGITTGPDGALWVTTFANIWRLTTDGQSATEFPLAPGIAPHAITAGPDGALWFTALGKIGRISTSGKIRYFTVPSQPNAIPGGITAGPDGALWFTEGSAKKLGRISTAGQFTEYPITPLPNGAAGAITVGADQALWFTDNQGGTSYIVRAG
jgi:virginiamycin B lyase